MPRFLVDDCRMLNERVEAVKRAKLEEEGVELSGDTDSTSSKVKKDI